jgi:hypothetical protein
VAKVEEEESGSEDEARRVGVKRELVEVLSDEASTSQSCKRIKTDPTVKSESIPNGQTSKNSATIQPTIRVEAISLKSENIEINEVASTSTMAVVTPTLCQPIELKLEAGGSKQQQLSSSNQQESQVLVFSIMM